MMDSACQKLLESRVPEFKDDIKSILSSSSYSSKELKLAVKNNVLISEADDGIHANCYCNYCFYITSCIL